MIKLKKKAGEMTFKEFWKAAEKEGIDDSEVLENTKRELLKILKEDGFTEKEITNMKMEKVWNFLLDNVTQYTTLVDIELQKWKKRMGEK